VIIFVENQFTENMYTTFHLNSPTEITTEIIDAIKLAFKNKAIVITVSEEVDTDYLKSSTKNRKVLNESIMQDIKEEYVKVKFKAI